MTIRRSRRFNTIYCITLLLAGAFLLASPHAMAASATGMATVTIDLPARLASATALSFGPLTRSASPATVTVAPVDSSPNQPAAATFLINGANNAAFSLALPQTVTATNGHNTLLIDNFSSNIGHAGTAEPNQYIVRVGARLHLTDVRSVGAYTNTFNVTVEYE